MNLIKEIAHLFTIFEPKAQEKELKVCPKCHGAKMEYRRVRIIPDGDKTLPMICGKCNGAGWIV